MKALSKLKWLSATLLAIILPISPLATFGLNRYSEEAARLQDGDRGMVELLSAPVWFAREYQPEAYTVGVRAGDWVKYGVTRLGPDSIAWRPPPMGRAVWVKVEVQNVSGTIITACETIHLTDGSDRISTISWDLQERKRLSLRYILPANLSTGDLVGNRDIWITYENWKNVNLTLNATLSRSYGGVTREVNQLKWSYLLPYFEYVNNNTEEYYWDRETGFLLEKTFQVRYVELGNTPMSTLQLKIADTNMWQMETKRSFPWTLVVGIPVGGMIVAVLIVKLRNKKNESCGKR